MTARLPFDLAIVGGGPAGGACALAASRLGLRVAIFEPNRSDWDKPWGEGLMPEGVAVLRQLGLTWAIEHGVPFAGLRYVIPGARPLLVPFSEPGLAIPRPDLQTAFDAAIERAPSVMRFREAASVESTDEGFLLEGTSGTHVFARTFVAADGTNGRSAPWLGRRHRARRRPRTGIRARYAAHTPLDRVEIHFGNGCEVYLTPLPQGRINAAILFDEIPDGVEGPVALTDWALQRHPEAASRMGGLVTMPQARTLPGYRARALSDGRSFLAGDAGWAVDPIVGCGVTLALESGRLAAESSATYLAGQPRDAVAARYERRYRRAAAPRERLAGLLEFLSGHRHAAAGAAFVLARAPRLLGFLASRAAGTAAV